MPTPVPTRVLQVIARLNVGGPASQVLAAARHLDGSDFRMAVAAGRVGPDEAEYPATTNDPRHRLVRIDHLGPDIAPADDARAFARLSRLIARTRPDVVHTHTAKAGVLGRLAAFRHGVPTVHTFHGHLLDGYFSPRVRDAIVAAERALARRTDLLIAVGDRVRDELLTAGIGHPDQYRVIRPAVDPPPTPDRATARVALDLPDDAAVVAATIRLVDIKRPDRLVDAVAHAQRTLDRPVVLVIAGDGPQRARSPRRCRRGGGHDPPGRHQAA